MHGLGIFVGAEVLRVVLLFVFKGESQAFVSIFERANTDRDSLLFGSPSPAWYALLFSFAYRFTKDWFVNRRKIERLETERLRNELVHLKAQINPHFLFNNLNTLDCLIDEDPPLAKSYLHKMGRLYRYLLISAEQDTVPLSEELSFADDYIFLLKERFGGAYIFENQFEKSAIAGWLIPPASIQTLIENVVKHNQASPNNPLLTMIRLNANQVEIAHEKRPKSGLTESLGTGLNNLNTRFLLICQQPIAVTDGDRFVVALPLMNAIP